MSGVRDEVKRGKRRIASSLPPFACRTRRKKGQGASTTRNPVSGFQVHPKNGKRTLLVRRAPSRPVAKIGARRKEDFSSPSRLQWTRGQRAKPSRRSFLLTFPKRGQSRKEVPSGCSPHAKKGHTRLRVCHPPSFFVSTQSGKRIQRKRS